MRKFLSSIFGSVDEEPEVSVDPQRPPGRFLDPDKETILKIVLIGGSSVGKSSILRRFQNDLFTQNYLPTFGIDLSTSKLQMRRPLDTDYRLQFWDVAHAEVRGAHLERIFNGAAGVVMVFDCSNIKSVTAVDEWRLVFEHSTKNKPRVPMVLLANKCDIGQSVIKSADLDNYCGRGGYALWRFSSAKNGANIQEAFEKLIDIVLELRATRKQQQQQQQESRRKAEKLISSKSTLISSTESSQLRRNVSSLSLDQAGSVASSFSLSTAVSPKLGPIPPPASLGGGLDAPIVSPGLKDSGSSITADTKTDEGVNNFGARRMNITDVPSTDDVSIPELKIIAETFYAQLKADLFQLFSNVDLARRSDLQILECQRFEEWQSLLENLSETNAKKVNREHIHIALSENVKKWNLLVMNLHTEVSLLRSNENLIIINNNMNSQFDRTSQDSSVSSSATGSPPSTASSSNMNKSTDIYSPNSIASEDNSENGTPRNPATKKGSQTRRMGFGFRNAGKSPVALAPKMMTIARDSFLLDADNVCSPPSPPHTSPTTSLSPSSSPASSPRSRNHFSSQETQKGTNEPITTPPSTPSLKSHVSQPIFASPSPPESNGKKQSDGVP